MYVAYAMQGRREETKAAEWERYSRTAVASLPLRPRR